MTGRLALSSLVLCLAACAPGPRGLRSDGEVEQASSVDFDATFDEVYDAAWLAMEKLGFTISAHDRRAGTFRAERAPGGAAYDVQATVVETRARLQLSLPPGAGRPADAADIEALLAQVKVLLQAWRSAPEFDYLKVSHAVLAVGVRLPLPSSWNTLELRTDRRWFKLQLFKRANEGFNPTLLVVLDRRRPLPTIAGLLQEAARLSVPDAQPFVPEPDGRSAVMTAGGGQALSGWTHALAVSADPFDLDCLALTTETLAWTIQVAASCPRLPTPENAPDQSCVRAVRSVFEGARRVADRAD